MFNKKRKLNKKTRNTISGLLVGLASLYAVSVYLEIPQGQLNTFLLSTLLLFVLILILAGLAILILKLLGKLKEKVAEKNQEKTQGKDRE